jgi:hypothetical protein
MKARISPLQELVKLNRRLAESLWGAQLCPAHLSTLAELSMQFGLSLSMGDVLLLEGGWYVTHSGLIRLARRNRCAGIHVRPVPEFSDSAAQRWAFEATVYKSRACRGFIGYGDADPSNVAPLVRGAEMRVAETRAVNRALRKAYGIGLCSVEEIGSFPRGSEPDLEPRRIPPQSANGKGAGNGNGIPRVRDRLVQLIRQHQLDPDLVKAYAVDFCGAKTLKEATRARVESFVEHLAEWAAKDRDALLCQLNSYPRAEAKNEARGGAA